MSQENTFDLQNIPDDFATRELSNDGLPDDVAAYKETGHDHEPGIAPATSAAASQWRPAKSIYALRQQVNSKYPGRNKASDGIIGDTAHCPGSSDHCPNIIDQGVGVVTAIDITHDPDSGCDMHKVTRSIANDKDGRIKYIIYNHQICSSYPHSGKPAWTWRPYSGSNAHTRHAHFSVVKEKAQYDDDGPWALPDNEPAIG